MSDDPVRPEFQPKSVAHNGYKGEKQSFHKYLDGEIGEDFYRGGATPRGTTLAEEVEDYLDSEKPQEENPDLGPHLLEEALKEDHDIHNVTEYHVIGFGSTDQFAMLVGVEYFLGHNFDAEAAAKSKSASSNSL